MQCKHYARSSYSTLRSHLIKEAKKAAILQPSRYILATSSSLTPANKSEIRSIFSPYVLNDADVLGSGDLNNLLGKFPGLEKANFKLWLTSAAVLDKLLHSQIYNQTQTLIDELQRKARLYVPSISFPRAHKILQDNRICIIAGIPGIGKSMLADMLLVSLIDQDFEPVVISSDVGEGDAVFKPDHKQVFYYDDFLGQASHADKKLNKNEDARILLFMRKVSATSNKRFILTTREYILSDARMRYEKLADIGTRVDTCVIALDDYTELARAKILYNHLYFSSMERATRNAVLKDRTYLAIVRHKNYNPRLIETIVDLGHKDGLTPDAFLSFVRKTLDEPTKLWQHAFEQQLPPAARAVLVALVSLSFEVDLEDLNDAFAAIMVAMEGRPPLFNEFQNSLKILEDTFIRTQRISSMQLATFHNPSIRDFMLATLNNNSEYVRLIIEHSVFFDQTSAIWRYATESINYESTELRYVGIAEAVVKHRDKLFDSLCRTMGSRCTTLETYNTGNERRMAKESASIERRLRILLEVADGVELPEGPRRTWLTTQLEAMASLWASEIGHKIDAISLFEQKLPVVCRRAAHDWFKDDLENSEDVRAFIDLHGAAPDLFSAEDLREVAGRFHEIAADEVAWVLEHADDAGSAEEVMDRLRSIAHSLDTEFDYPVERVEARIERLSRLGGEEEDYDPDRAREDLAEHQDAEQEIDTLFGSLDNDELIS